MGSPKPTPPSSCRLVPAEFYPFACNLISFIKDGRKGRQSVVKRELTVLCVVEVYLRVSWRDIWGWVGEPRNFILSLTIIPRARVGYEMIDSQRGA